MMNLDFNVAVLAVKIHTIDKCYSIIHLLNNL